jgi:hypothetical protein
MISMKYSSFIWSSYWYLVRRRNYAAPYHMQFYTLRLSTFKDKERYKSKGIRELNKSLRKEEWSGDKPSPFLFSTVIGGEFSASLSGRFIKSI